MSEYQVILFIFGFSTIIFTLLGRSSRSKFGVFLIKLFGNTVEKVVSILIGIIFVIIAFFI
jgi:hypothetical protein